MAVSPMFSLASADLVCLGSGCVVTYKLHTIIFLLCEISSIPKMVQVIKTLRVSMIFFFLRVLLFIYICDGNLFFFLSVYMTAV